ncbi:MAG TPA: hypothetical protein VMN99_01345 [Anaerolineales bacterium]|nr:hypothetical protein [Anaerolineales bacterium]
MSNIKLLASMLLVLAVLFAQVGNVAAAPQTQDTTPITGTVQSITTETDANGVTTVVLTLLDDQGTTQTVRLSVDTAVALGLVTLDPTTQEPVVDENQIGQIVEIDSTTVIPDEEPVEETFHPIAALLASFFGEDASVVNSYHEDGLGFGVIAQAMWMAQELNGDPSTAGMILEAKESGDYSAFVLPDGSTPTNWGQFKKAALGKDKKNLGMIVSGHAEGNATDDGTAEQENGTGNNKDKDKGKGKDKDKNKNRP